VERLGLGQGASVLSRNIQGHVCVEYPPLGLSRSETWLVQSNEMLVTEILLGAGVCAQNGSRAGQRETICPVTCLKQQARKMRCRPVYGVYEQAGEQWCCSLEEKARQEIGEPYRPRLHQKG